MKKIKKIIASIIISSLLLVSVPHKVGAWETWGSIPMGIGIEEVLKTVWAMLLSALKQMAIKTLKDQVESMVGGGGGENQMIMNYEDFIYNSIRGESEEYLSDFFSSVQSGASPGESDMLRDVEKALRTRLVPPEPMTTLSEIVSSSEPIEGVFDHRVGGGIKALLSYELGPYNNPYNAYYNAEAQMMAKVDQLEDAARTEGVAGQGFKTMTSGNKVMPGSIYQHLVATAEATPIDMITNATKWQEVLVSFASSMIGAAIKNGISTSSKSDSTDSRRVNRTNSRGYPGIQTDIYMGR